MVHFQVSNAHTSWNSFQRFWLNHLKKFPHKCISIYQNYRAPIIGVVWGERGLISWLLSRKFGSYLTHRAHEAGAISAPGQSTAEDLGRCFLETLPRTLRRESLGRGCLAQAHHSRAWGC